MIVYNVVCFVSPCRFFSGAARLVGSSSSGSGRVEVYLNGQWGAVCDSHWSDRDASVICRQLGLGYDWREQKKKKTQNLGSRPSHSSLSPPLSVCLFPQRHRNGSAALAVWLRLRHLPLREAGLPRRRGQPEEVQEQDVRHR